MLCLRCGHDSPPGSNFCQKCNAKLLQVAPTGDPMPTSTLEFDDKTHYMSADRYVTEHIYNLTCRAAEYLHQGASGEPLLEAFQVCKTKLEEFKAFMPEFITQLQQERANHPEYDFAAQILYQVNHGLGLFEQGASMFEVFAEDGDDDLLVQAVTSMQDGNDHLCLANELIQTRAVLFQKMVDETQKLLGQ